MAVSRLHPPPQSSDLLIEHLNMPVSGTTYLKHVLALLISAALLIWFLNGAHWQSIVTGFKQIDLPTLIGTLAAFAVSYLMRAMRVFDEFKSETRGQFLQFLRLTLVHNASVNIVPFRGGEASFPILLKHWFDVPLTRSVVALLWLRIQDAFVVAALAIWIWPALPLSLRLAWMALLIIAAWAIPSWARRHPLHGHEPSGRVAKIRRALAASSQQNLRSWGWTLGNWSIKLAAQAWLLASLLHADLSVGSAGTLGAELAAILPIQGVAGFGTYEAGAAALMQVHGISLLTGLQAALSLHLFVIACALSAGALAMALLPGHTRAHSDAPRLHPDREA